jgi:hypothetical protein
MLIFGSLPAPVGLWICPVYSGVGRWFLSSGFITGDFFTGYFFTVGWFLSLLPFHPSLKQKA